MTETQTGQSLPRRWSLHGQWDTASIMKMLEMEYTSDGFSAKISGASSLSWAGFDDIAFCSYDGEKAIAAISRSNAGIILCKKTLVGLVDPKPHSQLVFVSNPRFAFVHFVNQARSNQMQKRNRISISSFARIHETAVIGNGCVVNDYAIVGPGCILGDNVVVGERVSLVQNCIIGSNSILQPGAVLGADGFAFERNLDGSLERFPHFGGVVVGRNVEISLNCSIARGSLDNTVIGDGTKLDSLVHIAHNTVIGRNCQLTAGTIVGGSAKLGDSCWAGLNCTVKDHVQIGDNVLVASGASVIGDVADGDIVGGVPAKSIKGKISTKELFIMIGKNSS